MQQMLFPRGGIWGVPSTPSTIMESQIKKIKSHASGHGLSSARVRKEFLSPYTAVHNWVSALPGATSPCLFFPFLFEATSPSSEELYLWEQGLKPVWQS